MKTRFRAPFLFLALFLGVALIGSSGMVGGASAAPFQVGVNNVLDKVECVASFLREELQINVPDTFTQDSGIAAMVNQMAVSGVITRDVPDDLPEAQKQDVAAGAVIREVLDSLMSGGEQAYAQSFPSELLAKGFTANQFWNILVSMSEQLPKVPYDYCLPEAFEPGATVDPEREKRPDDREDYKRPDPEPEPEPEPEPVAGFRYYGEPYDLDEIDTENDTRILNNGVVPFTDENFRSEESGEDRYIGGGYGGSATGSETVPAAAMPLFFIKHTETGTYSEGGGSWTCTAESDPNAPVAFRGTVKSDPLYRYSWDVSDTDNGNGDSIRPVDVSEEKDRDPAAVQSTLYNGSNAIAFAYGKNTGRYVNNYLAPKPDDYSYNEEDNTNTWVDRKVFVGLHPGGEGSWNETWEYGETVEENSSMVGLEGQPGEGEPRADWDEEWEENGVDRYGDGYPADGDLSREFGAEIPEVIQDGSPCYLIIGEMFGYGDDMGTAENGYGGFDLTDSAIVFMPDPADDAIPEDFHKYTVHFVPGELVVDRISDQRDDADFTGDQAEGLTTTVMDRAVTEYFGNEDLRASVDAGVFKPGEFDDLGQGNHPDADENFPGIENWSFEWSGDYKYGLQTVGAYDDGDGGYYNTYTSSELGDGPPWFGNSIDQANADGFLAYMTQEDEHVLNQAIYNVAKDIDKYDIKVNTIADQDRLAQIKAYDAWYTQVADAQAGRVVRDRVGNLVRTQQYILRPDDQTVQVLNVSMRTGDAGNLSGLSIMDFTTTFTGEGYARGTDLRNLPWTLWLDTQTIDGRYVFTTLSAPELAGMSVKFTNPVNESLKESRTFDEKVLFGSPVFKQDILTEQLTLESLGRGLETYDYVASNPIGSQYTVEPFTTGFSYALGGGENIDVNLYETYDGSGAQWYADGYHAGSYYGGVTDIWDAMRVGEPGGPSLYPDASLEIAIDQDAAFFSQPIDVVYVPMSHMAWRNYETAVPESPVVPQ